MKFWFLTDTPRLAQERASVERLTREAGWFSLQRWGLSDGRFCAEGVIRAREADYAVRLVYPDQFPQVPAWVEPQDPEAKWTHHQYGIGGPLCLELRPDTWEEEATGADVLTSAYRLLNIENPLGIETERAQAPSAHRVSAVQSYDWGSNPLLISAGCQERVRAGTASALKACYSTCHDEILPVFLHDETDRKAAQHPPTDTAGFSDIPVFVSRSAGNAAKVATREDLRAVAMLSEDADAQLKVAKCGLVLLAGGTELQAFLVLGDAAVFRQKIILASDGSGVRSGRSVEAVGKSVAVVGAGSVGSKLAECLLRSGVRDLILIDGDVMLPANLERHTLDWRDVGFRKVKALKRRLLSIVPGANVAETANNLDWQRSAKTHAWQVETISNCEVIVDATGDVPTALFLGAVAAANGRPFVSVEVFEGGIGALVASCVPKRDPPYGRARTAFSSWCEMKGVAAPKGTGRPYESLSDGGTPVVADDAAVMMAAAHGSRVVLDILDGNPAPREEAWLLIGFRREWLFDGHGSSIRLSVGSPDAPAGELLNAEALAFAASIVKEAAGESDSSQ